MRDPHPLLTPAHDVAYPPRVWGILTGAANLRRYAWTLERARARPLLDVGCSWGYESVLLARECEDVTALDRDMAAVEATRALARANRVSVEVVRGDAYALPFPGAAFPCVCCSEVLEHLARPADAIAELVRVCSETLIVTVPAHGAMRSTAGHINDFTPAALAALLAGAGVVVEEHVTDWPFQYVRGAIL